MPQEFAFPSIDAYLVKMLELGASDLFLRPGTPPTYRVNGSITRTDFPTPSEKDMRASLDKILTSVAKRRFDESPDIDIAYTMPGKGRFRINLFMHQGQLGLAARAIPIGRVEFKTLSLPAGVLEMVNTQAGLILVVGPTGCGKSTTLAALIHHINATRDVHIMTIEDPIEFVHEEIRSLIHQRQVGYDTESFARALRHIVRQSPDVILIGEMRDNDTMQTALSAALTGHLILSTLHTTNAVQSIDRILNYFPAEARAQAQVDLAITLIGIVSMRLLRKTDGSGRIPAVEILLATPTIRRLIKEGEFVELYDVIKRSQDYGMCSFNQSLIELVQSGQVTEKEALPYAPNPEEFMLNIQGMYTGIDSIDLRAKKKKEEEKK
ncbi:MAG: PilT/PilU family type 4a pilus ATPase [Candidatus Aminicenantes bacterium]|nr:PilT/PilU family type 4a pilus ATPase [Candidatus Aminicenantes bacterium]